MALGQHAVHYTCAHSGGAAAVRWAQGPQGMALGQHALHPTDPSTTTPAAGA